MNGRNNNSKVEPMNLTCPLCGSDRVNTRFEEKSFRHGSGESAPILCATIPVHECRDCGFEFTTSEAHMKCHEAVCRYLGVMTPSEIRDIRQKLNLTQAQFADLTGIAIASINSWEQGKRIQSNALDNFIFLLGSADSSLEALLSRDQQSSNFVRLFSEKFVCLDEHDLSLMNQANAFAL